MSKFLTISAIIMFATLLIGGLYQPSSSFMWLASVDSYFAALRGVVVFMLVTLLVTSPPRSATFRSISGVLAIIMIGTILNQLTTNTLMVLDALAFIQASIILGIAALEPSTEPQKYRMTSSLSNN